MTRRDPDAILVVINPSQTRRWIGILSLVALGGLLIWVAFAGRPAFQWQIGFFIGGIAALWASDAMRRATCDRLELTSIELRTDKGVRLALVEDVRSVERGAFAFKPSNGFLARLKKPYPRAWSPGLWWRFGKFLGVGGVVPGGQARALAEVLTALAHGIELPDMDD